MKYVAIPIDPTRARYEASTLKALLNKLPSKQCYRVMCDGKFLFVKGVKNASADTEARRDDRT
jgi:hypothetical protein